MNHHHHYSTTRSLSVAALTLALGTAAPVLADENKNQNRQTHAQSATSSSAQNQSTARSAAHASIRVASDEASQRGVENLVGNDIRGVNGQKIGTIKDFVVDPSSGKVVFAVVSSGGVLGIGDTLRLVPFQAIKQPTDGEAFTSNIEQVNWNKLPTVAERDFERGMLNVTEEQKRQIRAATVDQTPADFGRKLVRIADIQGKSLQAGGREIGGIDDVVIDFSTGTAMVLVEAESDFAGADRSYLVPLAQLQINEGTRETITTTLTRADFERAAPARDRVTTTDISGTRTGTSTATGRSVRSGTSNKERLAPTGRTSETGSDVAPVLQSAARAVRQIWDAHPELAKLNLQVAAEDGQLVFRGTVPNKELWERAKDTAEGVVRGIEIQNRISIKSP